MYGRMDAGGVGVGRPLETSTLTLENKCARERPAHFFDTRTHARSALYVPSRWGEYLG